MFNISRAYQRSTSEEVRQELADMYILMTQHLLDQGYMDGSGLVTTHHWGYSSRWWYISAMLMANELDKHQLRQPVSDALLWYSREFKANFDMVPGPESSDLDYFNTLSRQHLALLMLESDPAKRVALLKRLVSTSMWHFHRPHRGATTACGQMVRHGVMKATIQVTHSLPLKMPAN